MAQDARDTREAVPAEAAGKKGGAPQVVLNALGILLCVIFIPIIIINVVMIVRSYANPDSIPFVFGYSPVIVLSGSMSPEFEAGDMIVIRKTDNNSLQAGDVICYLEEESAVTHRIIEVQQGEGSPLYVTQGDANDTADTTPVVPEQIQGRYTGVRLQGVGDFAIFLQSTPGMLLFIGGPIALFLLWDVFRRAVSGRKVAAEKEKAQAESASRKQELEEMEKELARLRAQVGEGSQDGEEPPPEA